MRRFGCREIKVPSAPIFFKTVYRHVVLVKLTQLVFTIVEDGYAGKLIK